MLGAQNVQRHDERRPPARLRCESSCDFAHVSQLQVCLVCFVFFIVRWFHSPRQGKIVAQGRLLLQDTFMVSEPGGGHLGRMKERRVFLFEQLVIFSEPLDKKKGFSLPGFLYKNSIKVRAPSAGELTDEGKIIKLRYFFLIV